MASIFDQARNVLKNLQGGATNVVNSFNFDPTSNNGKNFWSTPVAQGLGQAQRFLESPKSINIPQAPRQLNPTINVGFKNTPFQTPIQPVQMARDIVNVPFSFGANTLSDVGVNLGRTLRGDNPLAYTQAKSPTTRLGMQIGGIFNPAYAKQLGVLNTPQQVLGNIAGVVEGPLSVYGGEKLLSMGNQLTKPIASTFIKAVTSSMIQGGTLGGAFGVVNGLAEGRNSTLLNQLTKAGEQGALGTVAGSIFGGVMGTSGYAFGKVWNTVSNAIKKQNPTLPEKEVTKRTAIYLRDTAGKFIKGKKQPVERAGGGYLSQGKPVINDWQAQLDQEFQIDKINLQGGFIKPDEFLPKGKPKSPLQPVVGKNVANPPIDDIGTYYIRNGANELVKAENAKPINLGNNVEAFSHRFGKDTGVVISEAKTGMQIATGKTEKEAIANAQKAFKDLRGITPQQLIERQLKSLVRVGESDPKLTSVPSSEMSPDLLSRKIIPQKSGIIKETDGGIGRRIVGDLNTDKEAIPYKEVNRFGSRRIMQGANPSSVKSRLSQERAKIDQLSGDGALPLGGSNYPSSPLPQGKPPVTDIMGVDINGKPLTPLPQPPVEEVKRVADNLIKNNPGLGRTDAEAMAKDVIRNRPFNQSLGGAKGEVAQIKTQTTEPMVQTPELKPQKLAPSVRNPQQLPEAQSVVPAESGVGGVSNPGGKAPSDVVAPDSSKYSYNINKNKLQMTEGQKQTLDTTVTAIKPELEKLKGTPLGNKEVVKAAKTSEMLTQVTSREQTMQAEAAILKARQRVVELNNNIDRLAKEGNTVEMEKQMKDLVESLRVVSSTAADTGRKLQSFNISAGDESIRTQILKEVGKTNATTDDILNAAKNVDWNNADSITKFYRKFVKPSFMDVLDEYRYNNMLSNPKTHIRNAFSNLNQTFITRPMTLVVEGKPVEAAKYFTGSVKSLPEAMQAFTDSFKGKTAIGKPDMNQIGTGKLPKFLTVPTRAMEAGDQFFTALIKGGEQARGATAEQAAKTAEYSLFRQGLNPKGQGSVLNAVDSLTNWTYKAPKAVRWFVPFIRTPMNFAKQWIEYSPAGFATAYKAGAPREQIAKAVLGSTVAAFGGVLAMQGKTTWAAPTDPKQKDLFYASGRKPFSILVGDKWVPMQYAGPFALALALPAAMKFYQEDNRTAPTDSQIDKAVKVVSASAQFFSQQTFLSGLGNFVNWASGNQDVTLGSSLGFTAQQIIPMEALISYVNSIIDPVYRKAPGFIPSIQKNIPGLSQQLPAYTDPNGEPSKRIPSNYVAPYDLGQQQKQYEPALQIRGEKLQNNAIFNKAIKPYTELDGQIKDLVKAGQTEKAKALILQNKDILIKGEEIKKFKSQFDEYYSDLDKVSASNQLTPEQKQQIITIIKQRIDLLNKAYSTFQSQGYQQ